MNYSDLILELKNRKCDKIMVTGPQRSGTTITSQMIAKDLNFDCFKEESFGYIDIERFVKLIKNNMVVQAPCLSAYCHLFKSLTVVFMRRNIEDILKSQKRINWPHDQSEKDRYFIVSDKSVAEVKYEIWDTKQKSKIINAFDLDYESIKNHSLWVEPEIRKNFHCRQTEI